MNLIGEHTDYNGGLALPFAIARGVTVSAEDTGGELVAVEARDLGERDEFPLEDPARTAGWRAFARGLVAELRPPSGLRLVIESDLPRGAGLSSSAALSTALALAILGLSGRELDRRELAHLCSRVENEWFGAHGGLLDQLAALFSRAGHALRIDFRTLELAHVPLDLGDWRLAVLDSGVARDNATSGYNQRRAECTRACALLGVETLRDVAAADLGRLPEPLARRALHVIEENERVERAVDALRRRDLPELGRLLDASHAGLRDLYEVSTPELEQTVEAMRRAGAAGARLLGGGFGGSALGLFPPDAEPPVGAFVVEPAGAARVL